MLEGSGIVGSWSKAVMRFRRIIARRGVDKSEVISVVNILDDVLACV